MNSIFKILQKQINESEKYQKLLTSDPMLNNIYNFICVNDNAEFLVTVLLQVLADRKELMDKYVNISKEAIAVNNYIFPKSLFTSGVISLSFREKLKLLFFRGI